MIVTLRLLQALPLHRVTVTVFGPTTVYIVVNVRAAFDDPDAELGVPPGADQLMEVAAPLPAAVQCTCTLRSILAGQVTLTIVGAAGVLVGGGGVCVGVLVAASGVWVGVSVLVAASGVWVGVGVLVAASGVRVGVDVAVWGAEVGLGVAVASVGVELGVGVGPPCVGAGVVIAGALGVLVAVCAVAEGVTLSPPAVGVADGSAESEPPESESARAITAARAITTPMPMRIQGFRPGSSFGGPPPSSPGSKGSGSGRCTNRAALPGRGGFPAVPGDPGSNGRPGGRLEGTAAFPGRPGAEPPLLGVVSTAGSLPRSSPESSGTAPPRPPLGASAAPLPAGAVPVATAARLWAGDWALPADVASAAIAP